MVTFHHLAHEIEIARPGLCYSTFCLLANRFIRLKMSAIEYSAKRFPLFFGQGELPKNMSTSRFCEVQIGEAGTGKACNTVYHLDQELISELLSFTSNQNLSAPVDGDTVILKQRSAEMLLVLSAVSRRWMVMCYNIRPLPIDKPIGPRHYKSLYFPGKSAKCNTPTHIRWRACLLCISSSPPETRPCSNDTAHRSSTVQ